MPQVRRVRSVSIEDREPPAPEKPARPTPRRRQAAQEAQRRRVAQRPTQDIPEKKSAPILFRILSWLGIILIGFVLGYLGASGIIEFMSRKLFLQPNDRIENQEDLTESQEAESARSIREVLDTGPDGQQVSLNLYYVKDGALTDARRNFVVRTKEDNIRDVVEAVLTMSNVPNAGRIKLLHVFRNGSTAFLDMPGQFAASLESMGERNSQWLMTGLVKTLKENFSPITQIRFLIDSKAPASGGTVNLAGTWKIRDKS